MGACACMGCPFYRSPWKEQLFKGTQWEGWCCGANCTCKCRAPDFLFQEADTLGLKRKDGIVPLSDDGNPEGG